MERFFNPLNASRHGLTTWTKKILRENGFKPRKKLGQNFVVDPLLLREVVSNVDDGSDAIEVGCGIGTLSISLIEKTRLLLCIEIDERLCSIAKYIVEDARFIVLNADALKTPFTRKILVSNVPYYITSDLLVKIARENTVEKAVLTLQREVAGRLVAKPGSEQYGRLTVLASIVFNIKLGNAYPPSSFYPKPEVSHRLVVLTRKRVYSEEVRALEEVTRLFFSQRRRLFEKVLGELGIGLGELGSIASRLTGRRIYMIDPDSWLQLAIELRSRGLL
jgi:16S rRNA (adenine1518-N6/adenine1519-N6)-dimethyltransferase